MEEILKALQEMLTKPLPKRNEIDYMCTQCQGCIFFKEVDMGMDGRVYLCKANEPKDNYFDGHVMRWVSAQDCSYDEELKKFYFRECPHFCSLSKIMEEKLKEIQKGEK